MYPVAVSTTQEIPAWLITLLPVVMIGTLVSFLWNTIISLSIYRMSKADHGVETLKTEIKDLTTKLVDERFRAVTHEINNEVNAFKLTLTSLSQTVAKAEKQFDDLWDGDHAIETKLVERIHLMQLESTRELGKLLERFATKEDLQRMQRNSHQ